MAYANTNKVEFIVDLMALFHGWLIYSYSQIFKLIKSKWLPGRCEIGSLTTLWHDHIACIDDTAMSQQKNSILIYEHALNHEPVPLIFG